MYASDINQIIAEYDADGNFVKEIGQCCSGANGFFSGGAVHGLACDASDNLWASDDGNGRIMKFNTKSGQWMQKITTNLGNQIYGISVGPVSGNVYVADYNNNRIRVYTAAGAVSTSWATNNGQAPFGVCTDLTETWVYCTVPTTIEKHTVGGTFITNYGTSSPPFNYNTPQCLWTDFQNNIYVADPSAGLVTRLTSNGVFLNQWGQGLQVIGSLMYSEFVVGDVYGGIYISDPQLKRIVKTSNKGYPLAHCCGKY
jgi:DNA-binding beta-propeller fold protein YncE